MGSGVARGVRAWLPVVALAALLLVVVAVVRTSAGGAPTQLASPAPSPVASPAGRGVVAVFVGDAQTAGIGASSGAARWSSIVSAAQGWRELNLGRAGTGYTARPPGIVCGYAECPTFGDQVARAVAESPDVVVVAGGQNDTVLANADPGAERAAISAALTGLREALPDAMLVVVGPTPLWAPGPALLAIDAEIRSATEAVCGVPVSLLGPVGFESSFVLADGLHLSDAGHAAVAARVLAALALAEPGSGTPSGTCGPVAAATP